MRRPRRRPSSSMSAGSRPCWSTESSRRNLAFPFTRGWLPTWRRRSVAAATRVVAVSTQDARLIRERFGGQRVDVVYNGIDRPYFEAVQADRDPRQILFLGGFDWRPNLDAVETLLDRIFPAVGAA